MKFLVVSGLIGSGTSLLAQLAHETGVEMGMMCSFPMARGLMEWEDKPLVEYLTHRVSSRQPVEVDLLVNYLASRVSKYGAFYPYQQFIGLGFKTPLAIVAREELEEAARRTGVELVWLLTERAQDECWRAICRKVNLSCRTG
ncbi:MAG: hypothetical protein ACRD2L_13945 [Terriglobia bacterium]